MMHKWFDYARIYRSAVIAALVVWLASIVAGCSFTFGDRVQTFQYDNRTEDAVEITIQYDGEDKEWPGATIGPRTPLCGST